MKTFLKFINGYKKYTLLTPIFIGFEVVVEIIIPFLMAKIVDGIAAQNININNVLKIGLLMILITIIGCFFGMLAGRFSAVASAGFAKNIRKSVFYKIQDFSFLNINKFQTSSLITRLTTDVNNIQNAFMMIIRGAIRGPLMLIGASVMAIIVNPKLSLIFILTIPLLAFSLYMLAKLAHPKFQKFLKQQDKMNLIIQENLIGIRVVKAFVKENYEKQKFNREANILRKIITSAEKIVVCDTPIVQFLLYSGILVILWFGGKMVIHGTMEIGQIASFLTYNIQILMSLMMMSFIFISIILSKASADRILEVLNEELDIIDGNEKYNFKNSSIIFKDVSFSYTKKKDNLILKDINLEIKDNESIAIIGGTGSGKSTLVQLLPRLYDIFSGKIYIGGNEIQKYNLKILRDNIAMVLQKNTLFSGTIRENLLWGNENATDEEIIEVCKKTQAHDFIMSFPNKYNTILGQGGINLSGGQKQRLCIARAILKKPKILILDDVLSAVDTITENKIKKSLNDIKMTKIIVAQRISTIKGCDRIIVLNDGKIDGIGTHEELLENNKLYKEIYYSQENGIKE